MGICPVMRVFRVMGVLWLWESARGWESARDWSPLEVGVRPVLGICPVMRVFRVMRVLWLWESARCESPPGDGNLPSDESLPGDGSPLVIGVSCAPH